MKSKYFYSLSNISFIWRIIIPSIILIIMGLIMLGSTSSHSDLFHSTYFRQIIWCLLGILIYFIIQLINIQFFYEIAYLAFSALLILLIVVFFMGELYGVTRWINLGFIKFQPSEFGKLILVFALAKYLSDLHENTSQIKVITVVISFSIIPAFLVFLQPDLGTAMTYLFIAIPILYWTGIRPFYLFMLIAPLISIFSVFKLGPFYLWIGTLVLVLLISQPKLLTGVLILIFNVGCGAIAPQIWKNLYPHQRKRILTFLDPTSDPQGAGYQIIQSITAIGSGGIYGKGLGQGTQTQLRYLPVRDTDFIISVMGEEFGLFGIMVVILTFITLFYWMITFAQRIHNRFASISLIGFVSILFFHIFVNMAMTVGVFPVTGLPAPFISYGGSFLLTTIIIIALANNVITNNI